MGRHSVNSLVFVAFLAFGVLSGAAAQAADEISIDVMVSRISQEAGEIDARAARLDKKLRDDFRYESLKVLKQKQLSLALNELATVELPNDKKLQLRLLSISERGVLVAVNVEGSVQSDMQIPNGHLVAIGAGRFEGGRLVISLEPKF